MWQQRHRVGKALTPHPPTARQEEKPESPPPRWPTPTPGCVVKRQVTPTLEFLTPLQFHLTIPTVGRRGADGGRRQDADPGGDGRCR